MKKGYLINQSDGSHYSYKIKDGSVTLFFSKIGTWTSHLLGKRNAKLEVIGDDYKITFQNKTITLDICELADIVLLAQLYGKTCNVFCTYKDVQENAP
jgi:hypothetical protein